MWNKLRCTLLSYETYRIRDSYSWQMAIHPISLYLSKKAHVVVDYTMQHEVMVTYNELKYTKWTAMVQDDTIMKSFAVSMVK